MAENVTLGDSPENVTLWNRPENVTLGDSPENVTVWNAPSILVQCEGACVPRMLQVGALPFCYKGQVGAGSPASEGVLELSAMVRGAGR